MLKAGNDFLLFPLGTRWMVDKPRICRGYHLLASASAPVPKIHRNVTVPNTVPCHARLRARPAFNTSGGGRY